MSTWAYARFQFSKFGEGASHIFDKNQGLFRTLLKFDDFIILKIRKNILDFFPKIERFSKQIYPRLNPLVYVHDSSRLVREWSNILSKYWNKSISWTNVYNQNQTINKFYYFLCGKIKNFPIHLKWISNFCS